MDHFIPSGVVNLSSILRKTILLLFITIIIFSGCSQYNKLKRTEKVDNCTSTLEGNVIETDKWLGDTPLLVTRTVGRNFEYKKGKILEITDDGVLFDENRRSIAYNPEPRLYSNDEIHSLVDETGTIVQGVYPDSNLETRHFQFTIQKLASDKKPDMFRIYPDEPFSYCIEPGEYRFVSLIWQRNDGNSDISSPWFMQSNTMIINVNRTNYLGDIYVNNSQKKEFALMYEYPLEELERPNKNFYVGFQHGWIIGVAGAVLTEAMRERGVIGILELQIIENLDYESDYNLPVRFTEIY